MYIDALRYGDYHRIRHGRHFKEWLAKQAARLSVVPQAIHNALLAGYSSKQVETFVGTAPVNTVAPVASGSTVNGQTLTCTQGTWTGTNPSFTYHWMSGSNLILGANGNTYKTVPGDVGALIKCSVVGMNPVGSATAVSNTIGPIT